MRSHVRIGAILSPFADWPQTLAAARRADEVGLDAVGFWDHYHSAEPELAYLCGWSAYGAIAAQTNRVHLVPMVLNVQHYEPGVLAKESSVLSIVSRGRFELGIGAGDWPESFEAWGRPFADRLARVEILNETVGVLRALWDGERVTFAGRHIRLRDAACTPVPDRAPRVVVGAAASRQLVEAALRIADEVNVYDRGAFLEHAREAIAASGRDVALSVFADWSWDKWPEEAASAVAAWRDAGVERAFISVGADDMPARVDRLGALS
jgi:alkanesulfonate monooxygenase SsuD/methylene tetrahydromethanopterin reductase-like flavin-dependent oxidoreductase (luciferase family)